MTWLANRYLVSEQRMDQVFTSLKLWAREHVVSMVPLLLSLMVLGDL